jgi:hypothetical protein
MGKKWGRDEQWTGERLSEDAVGTEAPGRGVTELNPWWVEGENKIREQQAEDRNLGNS